MRKTYPDEWRERDARLTKAMNLYPVHYGRGLSAYALDPLLHTENGKETILNFFGRQPDEIKFRFLDLICRDLGGTIDDGVGLAIEATPVQIAIAADRAFSGDLRAEEE
jgi:hypothetical protein